jgi:hypothetical protein
MAKGSLRRFDVQAKWSLWLSLASILTWLGMLVLFLRNWQGEINQVQFRADGLYQPVYLACTALTIILATFGLALGFNSAGQRRNDRQKTSWTGFFVGLTVLGLGIIFFAAFWLLKLPIKVG